MSSVVQALLVHFVYQLSVCIELEFATVLLAVQCCAMQRLSISMYALQDSSTSCITVIRTVSPTDIIQHHIIHQPLLAHHCLLSLPLFTACCSGGLRLVTPPNSDKYAQESSRQFDEAYGEWG